jgi:hypothetical protein
LAGHICFLAGLMMITYEEQKKNLMIWATKGALTSKGSQGSCEQGWTWNHFIDWFVNNLVCTIIIFHSTGLTNMGQCSKSPTEYMELAQFYCSASLIAHSDPTLHCLKPLALMWECFQELRHRFEISIPLKSHVWNAFMPKEFTGFLFQILLIVDKLQVWTLRS